MSLQFLVGIKKGLVEIRRWGIPHSSTDKIRYSATICPPQFVAVYGGW